MRISWDLRNAPVEVGKRGEDQEVRLRGFGLRRAAPGLNLPYKIEYVAIPAGVTPRLLAGRSGARRVVPLDLSGGGRAAAEAAAALPGRAQGAVSLGRTGYFRDQRFVEVRLTPVRVQAGGGTLEVHETPEAVLEWDPASEQREEAPPEDPLAEGAYQRLFINYEEGRQYRVRPRRGAPGGAAGDQARGGSQVDTSESDVLGFSSEPLESGEAGAEDASAELAALPLRARIRVSRDGLVQISGARLSAASPELAAASTGTLRLTYRGREVPIRVVDGGDGRLDAADFIEFYGRRQVEPATVLRSDDPFLISPIYALNDFTDTSAYWLEAGATGPARVTTLGVAPTGNVTIEPHWLSTAELDPSDIFRPYGSNDPWVACPRVADRSSSCSGSSCCDFPDHEFTLALPDYTAATGSAAVRVVLQGWTSGSHVADLSLNGAPLGASSLTWSLFDALQGTFAVSNAALTGSVRLGLSLPGNGTGVADSVILDRVEVDYLRSFRAASGALEFRFADRQARFAVGNFPAEPLTGYDLSAADALTGHPLPRLLSGVRIDTAGTVSTATFQQTSEGRPERRFILAAQTAILPPDEITEVRSAAVCDPALGADLIVIGHASLIDLTPGSPLARYVAHRASQGLRVRVVDVQDVYDQFAFGFPEPKAIRDFLACAYSTGAPPPPLYVLLLGDGTSDYKNLRAKAEFQNLVPAPVHAVEDTVFGYYAADEWLAAFRNDDAPGGTGDDFVPDALIGRISAGNAAEAENALEKILSYESLAAAEAWRSKGLFVAGDGNAGTAEDFVFVDDSLTAASRFTMPFTAQTLFYGQSPYDGVQASAFRTHLVDAINDGAAVINYVGHGNFTIWDGDQIFRNIDVASLANAGRLPVFISSTCLMSGYHLDVLDSLGELLVHSTPDTGGIAVVAPSGISNFNIDTFVNEKLYDSLMGPTRERRLGHVVLAARLALAGVGAYFDLENLTILGDPALRLTLPAPAGASNLSAAAGNLRVDLSWQPSPDLVAGYHVYRTQALNPAVGNGAVYTRLTLAPVSVTTYADTQVSNTVAYSYLVTAVDAEGFESAYSNLNTTCGASDVDCVRAVPYNPTPPAAPTGLGAADPGVGFRVDLTWSPNPEPDIKGYRVYYRTEQEQVYTSFIPAGLTARANVTGLTNGVRYFFVVTAINTSDGFTPPGASAPLDNESPPSAEVSVVPSLIQGIRPPARIRDLRMAPTADRRSLLLTWTRPLLDIYGGPAVVTSFQVHRGLSVDFIPTAETLVARLPGDQTSYLDTDALVGTPSLFYFVLAEDGQGLLSSASRALPTGINDLRLILARDATTGLPNGDVTFTWSPVTHDIEGAPTMVDHYDLYASSTAFGRATLSSATLLAPNLRTLTLTVPMPTERFFFLVAVDRRGNLSPF